jgi:hypothetical protein
MYELSDEDQVRRAPNGRFYAIWRGQPICVFEAGLLYFETELEAWAFVAQCNEGNGLAYLGELEATLIPPKKKPRLLNGAL